MDEILNRVVAIANNAGRAIMEIYVSPDNKVMCKGDGSPLTQADLESNRIICKELAGMELGWPILSEESAEVAYDNRKNWQRFWLIDPLDGTKEFVKRNGEFTVNIALIENGGPILGMVYAPALDVCYFAARGVGAFVRRGNEEMRAISVKPHVSGEILNVVSSRSHSDARTNSLLSRLADFQSVSMGSSLKLCLVAEGAAHFYPRLGPTMEWDTAAAHAVVNCAGGCVCDSEGIELQYNKPDLHNPEFFVFPRSDRKKLLSFVSE